MSLCLWVIFIMFLSMVVLSVLLDLSHPLLLCVFVLLNYGLCGGLLALSVSVWVSALIFLVSGGGILVMFLFVVSLCPSPVFKGSLGCDLFFATFGVLSALLFTMMSFSMEYSNLVEVGQSFRGVGVSAGLPEMLPLFGLVLLLCVVGVVSICRFKGACLGGY